MPKVSIIIPCYNEQLTIRSLLEAIGRQTFALNELEVIIADGMSSDQTRQEIASFQSQHPELAVRVVDNPQRIIPAALNRAIEAASGEYIVRLDAHSMPAEDYVERCIQGLESGQAENVGGVWQIEPGRNTLTARAIALAAAHPLGVGDALYRYATQAAYVDTVPFGSFKRSLLNEIGLFDETLLTNEDYEVNTRIRKKGGRVWLNPEIRSIYFARSTYGDLARQYFRYGYWKLRMLKRYPDTIRWRQALPPLFVLSLVGLLLLSIFFNLARYFILFEILFYGLILFIVSLPISIKQKDLRLVAGIVTAIATMHISWGAGFLWSWIKLLFKK